MMDIAARIREIADQNRAEGYAVEIAPTGEALPEFAREFAPSILARKAGESVLVEVVRNRGALAASTLPRLAELLETRPEWRLDLVVLEPQTPIDTALQTGREPSSAEIAAMLSRAESTLRSGDLESACVQACAVTEAAMRRVRNEAKLNGNVAPLDLLNTLYANGFMSRAEFDVLRLSYRIRTQIVHGVVHEPLTPADIHDVLTIAQSLLAGNFEDAPPEPSSRA